MKLMEAKIDGFGVWSGLRLDEVSPHLTVFYGPNEAGKTTLMQFMRTALYGFSTGRRQRYLPPLRGGKPGGVIRVDSPHGRFTVKRHDDAIHETAVGELNITAQDGAPQDERLLTTLLTGVDEAIFNNIFACGLREIQELGSLTDTAAADLLYKLSTGLDRVSLVDVTRELINSRQRYLANDDRMALVNTLMHKREQLLAELEPLRDSAKAYGRLLAQRDGLETEITRIEREQATAEHLGRLIDVALAVREKWHHRQQLDLHLHNLQEQPQLPIGAIEELNTYNERMLKRRRRLRAIKKERDKLRKEGAALAVERSMWRMVPRIEAVLEQQVWVTKLEEDIKQVQAEHSVYQRELRVAVDHLSEEHQPDAKKHPNLAPEHRAELVHTARLVTRAARRAREAEEQLKHAKNTSDSYSAEVQAFLAQRQERDLPRAIEKTGTMVANLRHRLQLDERIEQLKKQFAFANEDTHGFLDRQLLPVWVLTGLGMMFAVGVALIMLGMFVPELSDAGWSLAPLGLGGALLAFLVKQYLEHGAATQFGDTQRQIAVLHQQVEELQNERDAIDAQLPRGAGAAQVRLAQAERDLAQLEDMMNQESRRISASASLETITKDHKEAEDSYSSAKRRWRQALALAGLPENLDPRQLKYVGQRQDQRETLRREIDMRRGDLENRQKELRTHGERATQMLRELGIVPSPESVSMQFGQLRRALEDLQTKWTRREQIRRRLKTLKSLDSRYRKFYKRDELRRRRLLRKAGCTDETEFRHRVGQGDRVVELRLERDEMSRQIALALGTQFTEDMIAEQFEQIPPAQLEKHAEEIMTRRVALAQELQKVVEHRGRLGEQLNQLAGDRRVAHKQLELSEVEAQLAEAVERWQVIATTSRVLESIRKQFELDRQPQVLREASLFLSRLTEGHYTRIWTPLDRDTLLVDDATGTPIDVERLSRGTREQVFLSLRFALVAGFARRGVTLPMVLDDVLVNFDASRSRAAAETLKDFAEAGHQVIIFTCHEHIAELFLSLDVPTYQLPQNTEIGAHAKRMYLSKPVTVAAIQAPPPPPPQQVYVAPPPPPPQPKYELPPLEPEPIDDFLPPLETPEYTEPVWTMARPRLDETLYTIEMPEPVAMQTVVMDEPPAAPMRRRRRKKVIERETVIRKRPRAPFGGTTWHDPIVDDGTVIVTPNKPVSYYEHIEEIEPEGRATERIETYESFDEPPFIEQNEDYEAA